MILIYLWVLLEPVSHHANSKLNRLTTHESIRLDYIKTAITLFQD